MNDVSALTTTMQGGIDAVVSFLGGYITFSDFLSRDRSTPIVDSFPTLFNIMRAHNVKRIIVPSTPGGYLVPGEVMLWKWWLMNSFIPGIITPMEVAEMREIAMRVVEQDDFEWTGFRVPYLNDGDAGLKVEAGFLGGEGEGEYKGSFELSWGSLGRWVLCELREGEWVGKCPVASNLG